MYKCLATEKEIKNVIKERRLHIRDKKYNLQYGDKICIFCSDGSFDLLCTVGTVEPSVVTISHIEIMANLFCDFDIDK